MVNWQPDTCECSIDNYNSPTASFAVRCKRHKTSTVADVLTENKAANMKYGTAPTAAQVELIQGEKKALKGLSVL